tara:strand:- start:159 stop:332 length:174 start_codon:yes stop_codon:yes gene_type:complete
MKKKPPLYYVVLHAIKAYEQANFTEYRKAKEAKDQKLRREKGLGVTSQPNPKESSGG